MPSRPRSSTLIILLFTTLIRRAGRPAYIQNSKLFKLFNEMPKYKTKGQEDCADCEWIADETDGEVLICGECQHEQHINYLKFRAREEK